MNQADTEYNRLVKLVLEKGRLKKNRTGVDTLGIFGAQARFDLQNLPVLTTKKIFTKGVIHELLWFIKGDTNIKYLVDNDVHIWDAWACKRWIEETGPKGSYNTLLSLFVANMQHDAEFAEKWGELGEGTYGQMWRAFPYGIPELNQDDEGIQIVDAIFGSTDQLQKIIDELKNNPDNRRLIVSAWHPYWVDHCALPPCHCLFQFHTEELTESERLDLWQKKMDRYRLPDSQEVVLAGLPNLEGKDFDKRFDQDGIPRRRLNCQLYQRSCDLFLGVPFNILSYSLLTCMIAHCVNMVPGEFVHTYGDLHIYSNHMEQIKLQMSRIEFPAPKLWLNPEVKDLFQFKYEDIRIENYQCHPTIKGEVAV